MVNSQTGISCNKRQKPLINLSSGLGNQYKASVNTVSIYVFKVDTVSGELWYFHAASCLCVLRQPIRLAHTKPILAHLFTILYSTGYDHLIRYVAYMAEERQRKAQALLF